MADSYTIGKHYESLVKDLVDSGRYGTADDVLREGLRLVEQREAKLDALRSEIRKGLDSGPSVAMDINEIVAEGKRRKATAERGE